MGQNLCTAIAGFNAFTGSDYTASFLNKGKVRPSALMGKSVHFMTTFGKLGESSSVPLETIYELETYGCNMYSKPKLTSVNKARQLLFNHYFAPKSEYQPLYKIKGTNPSSFPPSSSVGLLLEKINVLIYEIYENALSLEPMQYSTIGNGWSLGDDEGDDELYYSSDDEYDSDSD